MRRCSGYSRDGSSVVTYGERLPALPIGVLSVPVGGTAQDPRLHALSLAASRVDWDKPIVPPRQHGISARRDEAEADYQL
jgi:hypothetical protein